MKTSVKTTIIKIALLGLTAWSTSANASVWVENNQWSPQWEDRFSEWIKNSFNDDIFVSGKYKDIPTDCADAVYLSRLIFAFENKLPFVMLDPTGSDGKISNRMSRYDGTRNEMVRFREFVTYVTDMGDTKTLPNDTYPIVISREYVRSGAIWSRPRIAKSNIWNWLFGGAVKEDPGHAEVIKNVTETGAIELIGSTVPSAVRKLISTSSLVFMPVETSTGIRKWMEPGMYGQPQKLYPGFSLEQFGIGGAKSLSSWQKEIQTRLQLREENKDEALSRMGADICSLVQARVDTILKSEKRRLDLAGQCMDADDYDSYSTPSRDKRIMTTIDELVSLGGGFGFSTRAKLPRVAKYLERCPDIQITPDRSMKLMEIVTAYVKNDISSNPNNKIEARWGMKNDKTGKDCKTF